MSKRLYKSLTRAWSWLPLEATVEVGEDPNTADPWVAEEAVMLVVNGAVATMEATAEAGEAAMATEAMAMEAMMVPMLGVMAEVIILPKLREVKLVVVLAALEVVQVGEQVAEGCKGKNLIEN